MYLDNDHIKAFSSLNCLKTKCSKDFSSISFYKRKYFFCNECSNQFAIDKKKVIFENKFFRYLVKLFDLISGWTVLKKNLLISGSIKNDKKYEVYDVYANLLSDKKAIKTYLVTLRQQLKRFKKHNIDFKNKKILILSGGPGILAKYLSKYSEVTVTEFSQKSVEAMRTKLKINSIKLDWNLDSDFLKLDKKYDLVISESNINYCENQKKFLEILGNLVSEDGTLVLSNDKPSFGYMLTWMYHDYMPNTFLTTENILITLNKKNRFEIIGWDKIKYNSLKKRTFQTTQTLIRQAVLFPVTFFYMIKILLPQKTYVRKFWSLDEHLYLKKHDHS